MFVRKQYGRYGGIRNWRGRCWKLVSHNSYSKLYSRACAKVCVEVMGDVILRCALSLPSAEWRAHLNYNYDTTRRRRRCLRLWIFYCNAITSHRSPLLDGIKLHQLAAPGRALCLILFMLLFMKYLPLPPSLPPSLSLSLSLSLPLPWCHGRHLSRPPPSLPPPEARGALSPTLCHQHVS